MCASTVGRSLSAACSSGENMASVAAKGLAAPKPFSCLLAAASSAMPLKVTEELSLAPAFIISM